VDIANIFLFKIIASINSNVITVKGLLAPDEVTLSLSYTNLFNVSNIASNLSNRTVITLPCEV